MKRPARSTRRRRSTWPPDKMDWLLKAYRRALEEGERLPRIETQQRIRDIASPFRREDPLLEGRRRRSLTAARRLALKGR